MPKDDQGDGVVEEQEEREKEHAHGEDDASQPEIEGDAPNVPDFSKEARKQAEDAESQEAQTPGPEPVKEGPTGIVDANGNAPEGEAPTEEQPNADPAAEAPETVPEGQVLVQVIQGEHGMGVKCAQGIDYHSAKGLLETAKSVLEADYLQKILQAIINPRIATPGGPGFRQPPKHRGPKH